MRKRRGLWCGALGIAWLGLGSGPAVAEGKTEAPPALDHPMLGEPAPEFRLPSLDGDTVELGDFARSHLVIHFGASW